MRWDPRPSLAGETGAQAIRANMCQHNHLKIKSRGNNDVIS